MWEQLQPILITALGTILTGVVSWLMITIKSYFSTKTKDKKYNEYVMRLTEIVTNAVNQVTQTYVSELKKAGRFDKEQQVEAFSKCYNIVNAQLTVELKEFIKDTFGDISSYLTTLIESTIFSLK